MNIKNGELKPQRSAVGQGIESILLYEHTGTPDGKHKPRLRMHRVDDPVIGACIEPIVGQQY